MSKNPVVYWELASHDPKATSEFLRRVFDWQIEYDAESGIFEIPAADDASQFTGGVFTLRKAKLPFLTMYIRVDDIDAKARRIEELGGFIVIAPFDNSSRSRLCLLNESAGVTLGMLRRVA